MTGGRSAPSSVGRARDKRRTITSMLADCDGNLTRTAHLLGIHRATLYRRIDELELWPVVNRLRRERLTRRRLRRRR
jgi:transcriptional regulator of acetoin/glycerol metabolism